MLRIGVTLTLLGTAACFSKPELLHDDGSTSDGAFDSGLVDNGDFELGCSSWYDADSAIELSPLGHAGSSCRVCISSVPYYYIAQRVDRPFVQGERYVARAWVRSTQDSPSHSVDINLELRDSRDVTLDLVGSPRQSLDGEWREITAVLDVDVSDGTNVLVRVGASYADGPSCFLVDDISLHRP